MATRERSLTVAAGREYVQAVHQRCRKAIGPVAIRDSRIANREC